MSKQTTTHILVAKAVRRPYRELPTLPPNATYDLAGGCWLLGNKPLVTSDEFLAGAPVSKKCDQETGEDQKGE
jgi:hypothetical protein